MILTWWTHQSVRSSIGLGNFDNVLTLWTLQVTLKFHAGGNFDIVLTLWTPQVSFKFHGGGNLDNVLLLWTARVIFKLYGGWNCLEEVQLQSCSIRPAQLHKQSWGCAICQKQLRNATSCASRVAQSWKLRKRSCAILGVAQAKYRNPSCAIRPKSCTILVAQSQLRNPEKLRNRTVFIGSQTIEILDHRLQKYWIIDYRNIESLDY